MIGQLHADKCDYHANDRKLNYLLADNWISYRLTDNLVFCMLSLRGLFFIVLRAMFIIFGLKSIIKQLLDFVFVFFHLNCIIKQLVNSGFVICKIINVSVRIIILAFGSASNSYLDIDNFHITTRRLQRRSLRLPKGK